MIKFTAIMPVYNSSKTLDRSIESLITQTYGNWELIIVDDGSTDDSLQKAKLYAKKDSRIKVFHQKNQGPGEARNYGILKSNGDYISFIDSDDYYENDYFQTISNEINKKQYDVVYFDIATENREKSKDITTDVKKIAHYSKDELIKAQMMGVLPWGAYLKTAKSAIIKKCKFSNLSVGEECVFSYRILTQSNSIGFIDKPLYCHTHNSCGQHKKGGIDPWRKVASGLKKELSLEKHLNKYERAINGLALRGLCIAIKRICCNSNYTESKKMIKQRIDSYSDEFNIYDIEKKLIDRNSKLTMHLIKLKLYLVLYIGIKIKYRGQGAKDE